MDWIPAVALAVTSIIVPFVVNLLSNTEMSSNLKRWVAIVVSIIAGVATGILTGVPTPETFVAWVLAVIGGVQTAYSLFKGIGVTSNILDSLENLGSTSGDSDKA